MLALPGVDVNAITLHQVLFFVWVTAMTVHVLGRVVPSLATLAGRHRTTVVPGRVARGGAVAATLAASALAGVLVVAGSRGRTAGLHPHLSRPRPSAKGTAYP